MMLVYNSKVYNGNIIIRLNGRKECFHIEVCKYFICFVVCSERPGPTELSKKFLSVFLPVIVLLV